MNEQEREALPLQECERKPFEAYMLETGYGIGALEKHGNGHYWDDEVSAAWWAWNRRAALATKAVPAGLSEWERSVLQRAATAIEMGPRAGLFMNVDGVVCNLRRLAATPPAPAPEAVKPCLIEGNCKHGSWCTEVYCQEHCKFVKEAPPAQAQQADRSGNG